MDHMENIQRAAMPNIQKSSPAKKKNKRNQDKRRFARFATRDVFVSEDLEAETSKLYTDNPQLKQRLMEQRQKLISNTPETLDR